MTKEGESVAGATRSLHDLAGKVSKTYMYVKRGLRGDGSKGDKHDPTISHRRDYVQRDE